MPSGGGGTTIQERAPTKEETALLQKQLDLLTKQEQWADMFEPMILDMMGYKKETTSTAGQLNPEYATYQAKLKEIGLEPTRYVDSLGGDGTYNTTESPSWTAWKKKMDALGVAPPEYLTEGSTTSTIRRMTDEERLASMTPTERADYEIQRKLQQRQLDALEGKLPVSPALESSMQREEAGLENELAAKLGPNWRLSTPATTKLGEFKKRAELVREEARRGMLDTASALSLSQGNKISSNTANQINQAGSMPNMWGGLLSGYQSVYNPLVQNRMALTQMDTQASMQRQANQAAMFGGLAQMGGMGLGAYAALAASSPKFKKNIKKADDEEVLDMVREADTYEFNYKGEPKGSPKRLGYMADEAPPGTDVDNTFLDLGKVTGLHAAAIKAMTKKIDKLEKRLKEK